MKNNYYTFLDLNARKKETNNKYYSSNIKLVLFLLSFFYVNLKIEKKRYLIHRMSEINLVVKGNYDYRYFDLISINPSETLVNGIPCNKLHFADCNAIKELNNITFRFESEIINCKNMFKNNLGEIIEIDLSKFDASKAIDMSEMFEKCNDLQTINFGNINTSSVEDIHYMFFGCSSLISIDLSNFDTSKVTNMESIFLDCKNLQTINFGNIITSSLQEMTSMFERCNSLKSIDLSNFDTSNVELMGYMFRDCKNLIRINFGNINTSSVYNMQDMFEGCSSLTSLNLSYFDTSKVHYMNCMFCDCTNLKSLDLSNFDIYDLISANFMFNGCSSLKYLNIFNFYFKREMPTIFDGLPSDVKFCIKDPKTLNRLLGTNIISECLCSNIFDKIIDINKNICIDSCINSNYNYEYNNTCYTKCPNNTFPSICEENECNNITRQCLDHEPQGYYLDINEEIYKRCFDNCESCYGEGNETNHNCKSCKFNYILINDFLNYSNCYNICQFYYYFDDNNEYHCTENETCPEKYNKLLINKKRCIEESKKDNTYHFEYNNSNYQNLPSGTILTETIINETILNETIINETILNETIHTKTIINETIINETILNETIINENILNETILTETILNETIHDETILNETINISYYYKLPQNISNLKELLNKFLINNKSNSDSNLEIQDELLKNIQKILENGFDISNIANGTDLIITLEAFTYTITTTANQKNNKNKNVSTIIINF